MPDALGGHLPEAKLLAGLPPYILDCAAPRPGLLWEEPDVKVGIVNVTGYAGSELARILADRDRDTETSLLEARASAQPESEGSTADTEGETATP